MPHNFRRIARVRQLPNEMKMINVSRRSVSLAFKLNRKVPFGTFISQE